MKKDTNIILDLLKKIEGDQLNTIEQIESLSVLEKYHFDLLKELNLLCYDESYGWQLSNLGHQELYLLDPILKVQKQQEEREKLNKEVVEAKARLAKGSTHAWWNYQ